MPGELTENKIAMAVSQYSLRTPYLVTFFGVFAIWLAFLHPLNPFELFERRTFGLAYEFLFCIVVAMLLSAGLRMLQIWVDLRSLLIELESRPIRFAFSRIKDITWSFWRLGGEEIHRALQSRAMTALSRLVGGIDPRESGVPGLDYFKAKIEQWS